MLVELDKVIRDACEQDGDTDYKYYMKFMRLANAAMRDLNLFVIPILKTEKFVVDSTRVIDMPSDFVYYTKVGLMRHGRVVTLSLNNDMHMEEEPLCDCENKDEADKYINDLLCGKLKGEYAYRFYGYGVGELYGMQGGFNRFGYYRFDKENNRFFVQGLSEGDELVIEYKSNGVGNGVALVPTECELAIVSFILWKSNAKTNAGFADRNYRDYKIQYEKLKKLYLTYTEREWLDTFWRGIKSTVKR
jgi:hypothetical protein